MAEVHFADDRNGWAYAPQLHVTHDGAHTWHRLPVPGGSGQVVALTSGAGVAYAVVSSCIVGDPSNCSAPARLWTTAVGSNSWARVAVTLPAQGTPQLSVSGRTAYLVLTVPGSGAQVFQASTDAGVHWTGRRSPCNPTTGEVLQVAAASPTDLALLCSTDVRPGVYTKRVFYSSDAARTSTRRGSAPTADVPLDLAASGRDIAIAGAGGSSVVQHSGDRGQTWTTPYRNTPAVMSDLALTGATGAVVRGTAALPGGAGQLLLSHDNGRHWTLTPVRVLR